MKVPKLLDYETLSKLRARSQAGRAAYAASRTNLRAALGELRTTVHSFRTTETRLNALLLNAHYLVFRRVVVSGAEPERRLQNSFYGADAEMIGRTDSGIVELNQDAWYARIHTDDHAAYRAADARRRSSGEPFTIDYRIRHAVSGETRWIRETAWVGRDAMTGETLLDSYLLDITEQKRAEAALRASEARYRTLLEEDENASAGCFGPDQLLTFVGDGFCRRFGRPRAELLGTDFLSLIPAEAAEACAERLASLSPAQPSSTHELTADAPDGTSRVEEWTLRALFDRTGRLVEYHAVGRDVTGRRKHEERLHYLAHHDALTGLPNRLLFQDRLRQALARASRDHSRVALMIVDLDDFKRLNDTLGHPLGDRALQAIGMRLGRLVRESDTVARYGGDEFVVLQTAVRDPSAAAVLAEKIIRSLAQTVTVDHHKLHTSASIGIALFPDDAGDPETLLVGADTALYRAKQNGRDRFCFFKPTVQLDTSARRRIQRDLQRGLAQEQFFLVYQPKFDLAQRRCVGFEALVRWRHPKIGVVLPASFIANAEASPLILDLGTWILEKACAQLARWRCNGRRPTIAVNLSPRQIAQSDLVELVDGVLTRTGLEPNDLELEITESTMVDLADRSTVATLWGLAELGVRLTVDDFGSGYSSLAYLSRLPVQTIKVDRTFVNNIGCDRNDEAIVRAVIGLSHSLDRRVVAEGVENDEQLAFLRAEACDEGQGFFLGRPEDPADAGRHLDA